jgi:hypothetical protein
LIISDAVLKACISGISGIANTLASAMAASKPERPVREAPEPPRLRPSQQKGLDMNDLRRAADRERCARRLPRSPEEARGLPRWWS